MDHRNLSLLLPGRTVRYLGVWYEEGCNWTVQKEILTNKFKDLNERISHSSPTREEAIYCINATINSALKYPLRVAHIDFTTTKTWDTANRKVVSKAGALPALSPLVYHLPKEHGGLALESLETAVLKGQVEAYIESLDKEGLNGQITRAGRRRYLLSIERDVPEIKTIHARVAHILKSNNWEITEFESSRTRVMQE